MNLVIDFGNTIGKGAIFQKDELVEIYKSADLNEIVRFAAKYPVDKCIISSTSIDPIKIQTSLPFSSLVLNHKMKFPFKIDYSTPETLGLDRIAAVAGAFNMFNGENCLVIDCGSCITYDLMLNERYKGGAISPGLSMRFKALNTFTANLPLVNLSEIEELVGDSTIDSIKSGVLNGARAELDEMIFKYCSQFGSLNVVICGGDYFFFENKLKASIFAAPELVSKGLNGILRYNA